MKHLPFREPGGGFDWFLLSIVLLAVFIALLMIGS